MKLKEEHSLFSRISPTAKLARLFGNAQERRRFLKQLVCRCPLEHWIWFINHYVIRLGLLEGRAGLIACRLRAQYIADVRAKLHEAKIQQADQ